MQNIIEKLREESVNRLFATKGFAAAWPVWQSVISSNAPTPTPRQIIDLGDHLQEIFYSTNTSSARSQSDVSGGGANWEALVCWYLNLCNAGRRTVVLKHHKALIPTPISNAITVNYNNFISNTESDLIAITFPDKPEYQIDKASIVINDENGQQVQLYSRSTYNFLNVLNALTARDFSEIEIHIIQCKTNWNDNAQIPMLWDMIYSSTAFKAGITIGREGYSINNARFFSYAFATVPTVKPEKITRSSVAVSRVRNLSGGNYWGRPSEGGIASSVKEMLNRNLSTGLNASHLTSIAAAIPELSPTGIYSYFNFPCPTLSSIP